LKRNAGWLQSLQPMSSYSRLMRADEVVLGRLYRVPEILDGLIATTEAA
jgi:hypothetical protein